MVLVDTTIWSLALRRSGRDLAPRELELLREWTSLVRSGLAALVGPIRQEILSGIREEGVFQAIRRRISDFRYLRIADGDYDQAALFFNICRRRGITGSAIDMLICAVASRHEAPIFTMDPDFPRYARHLPIRIHTARPPS